jgi:peptidoglycan L-alanyl-D-glutamate endopeptidase CwlK
MNTISLARLSQVHPTLRRIIPQLCAAFDAKFAPWHLEVTQGIRTIAEQHALYMQGRESTVDVNLLRVALQWAPINTEQNVIVTDADGDTSWHPLGCAVDVAPELEGVDWDGRDAHWEFIVATGESMGLVSGISWQDEPHFQLSGIPPAPNPQIIELYVSGGVQAVWNQFTTVNA